MPGKTGANQDHQRYEGNQPLVYQIRIKGELGPRWSEWFDDLAITLEEDGNTLLSGMVVDQAALHGILKKVRDLGMPLVSVNSVGPGLQDEQREPSE
jgi:hypothetical protein